MFSFCLIALVSVNVAFSSDLCVSETPCRCVFRDNTVIDLSSVGSPEYPRFYQVSFKDNCSINELYSYNPCFPFDSHDKHTDVKANHKSCAGAAACIRTPGGPNGEFPEEHVIGLQNTAVFDNSTGELSIKYTVPGLEKLLIVRLICKENSENNILEMVHPECSEDSEISLSLVSKCACPNGCASIIPPLSSSGLSVGSKLLIAFFTILLAYVVVGILWNFCNGSQGVELIPNLEFWNDLPTLIMEGLVFTCSCCGRQSSYGEV